MLYHVLALLLYLETKTFAKFALNKRRKRDRYPDDAMNAHPCRTVQQNQADTVQLIKLGLFSLHPQNFILSYKVTQLLQKSQP
jgi:hypothetical protein